MVVERRGTIARFKPRKSEFWICFWIHWTTEGCCAEQPARSVLLMTPSLPIFTCFPVWGNTAICLFTSKLCPSCTQLHGCYCHCTVLSWRPSRPSERGYVSTTGIEVEAFMFLCPLIFRNTRAWSAIQHGDVTVRPGHRAGRSLPV